ncbi:hypothetical protein A3860_39165 [Niastella vici]|uniref:Uncharacterized protein n=1 Tax=Niastella vici TaxID=1703345 RepID=A0A1V9FKS0_9BACT|nr:hypothetical protein [Niastella vici]OQP58954.1 hypothetical protein A3860_39165 [Niastella vici]
MAKKKKRSSTRKLPVYSKIKDPAKPTWMRVTKIVFMIVGGIIMVLAIIAIMIRYYRLISNNTIHN